MRSPSSPRARPAWTSCRTRPGGKPAPGPFRLGVRLGTLKPRGIRAVLRADEQPEEHGDVFDIADFFKTDPTAGKGSGRWRLARSVTACTEDGTHGPRRVPETSILPE